MRPERSAGARSKPSSAPTQDDLQLDAVLDSCGETTNGTGLGRWLDLVAVVGRFAASARPLVGFGVPGRRAAG